MSPPKKQQRDTVKKGVRRWCQKHSEFMADIERAMPYALKDGEAFTEADVTALLKDHCLQLKDHCLQPPFTVTELMRHW